MSTFDETPETVDETPQDEEVVAENVLSDEDREAQERHEALAADLGPGETLPWVAEPPSDLARERAIESQGGEEAVEPFPADEDAEGVGSDVPSSRHETVENPPDTEPVPVDEKPKPEDTEA